MQAGQFQESEAASSYILHILNMSGLTLELTKISTETTRANVRQVMTFLLMYSMDMWNLIIMYDTTLQTQNITRKYKQENISKGSISQYRQICSQIFFSAINTFLFFTKRLLYLTEIWLTSHSKSKCRGQVYCLFNDQLCKTFIL